jgi:hypothetical protein
MTIIKVPVIACKIPPFVSGSVGVAIDMSDLKRLKEIPLYPFEITVAKILPIGIKVATAPTTTRLLTTASFAPALPRVTPWYRPVNVA